MRLIGSILLVPLAASPALGQTAADEERAVREVVENAYIHGIHVARDSAAVRAGFHPDFVMSVNADGQVRRVTLDEWLARMRFGQRNTAEVRHTFDAVDVTGSTATVKLRVWFDDKHRFTDYIGLYRFDDGWKIVNKIFQTH